MAERSYQDFPVPRLDDRTFQDIVEEMRALIPVYAPEWTNHNPSDPGITLLELYAFMTEAMLQRLNRVPVRNLYTLLNLMGIQPEAPSTAKTPLAITPTPSSHGKVLPAGTQVASQRTGEGEPLIFETDFPVVLTTGEIQAAITFNGQSATDVTEQLKAERPVSFAAFGGATAKEQFLFIQDPRLLTLKEDGMRVHLKFQGASAHRDLYARWTWQIFDGNEWTDAALAVGHGRGEVILGHNPNMAEVEVNAESAVWIRAIPEAGEEPPEEISFTDLHVEVASSDEGVPPHGAYLNQGGESLFVAVDLTRTFYPFGENPQEDACFYVLARELFRAAGTRVELNFGAADISDKPRPGAEKLVLQVEYPAPGGYWRKLGTLYGSPLTKDTESPFALDDHTWGMTRAGVVSFVVPDDLVPAQVQGEEGPWIRIRLVAGNYVAPPLPDDEGGMELALPFNIPATGPHFNALKLRSRAEPQQAEKIVSFSDFSYIELWPRGVPRGTEAYPFPHRDEYAIALYLGTSLPFPSGTHGVYFKIANDGEAYGAEYEVAIAQQQVTWEYLAEGGFKPLPHVADGTLNLKRDGFVVFDAPDDGQLKDLFEQEAFWVRGRLTAGRYDIGPKIEDIRLNVPTASNKQTIRENRVLPSDGLPYQEVALRRFPVVGDVSVWVFEREVPRDEEINRILADLGDDAMEEEDGGVWFRWREVDHFLHSGSDGRHFRVDRNNGVVKFGDGIDGMIPPPNPRAIRIDSYPIGGGGRGNVGPGTLTVLKESSALVAAVVNPFKADGGAEAENVVDAARRGTESIYSVDRAIRARDYERMAYQASRRVARAYCLGPRVPSADGTVHPEDGAVRVILLPKPLEKGDAALRTRLIPSQEVVRRVGLYLEERRALNVRIAVRGCRYKSFSIEAALYTRSKMTQSLEDELKNKLFTFLHALYGGQDGQGWGLGQDMPRAALYQVLGGNPEVLSVVSLKTYANDGTEFSGSLNLEDDELPYLSDVILKAAHMG